LQGQVYQTLGKHHLVWDGASVRPAFPAGRLALTSSQQKNRVAVGDLVTLGRREDGTLLIESVLPRRSKLSRRITFTGAEHVVAANVDVLAVMLAPNPAFNTPLLDRYLVAAYSSGIRPMVLANKEDLVGEERIHGALDLYSRLGFRVIPMAAKFDRGLDDFMAEVAGCWVVLVGHSGVGKTTLVNHLVPEARAAVGAVHEARGKGRHTTASAAAYRLKDGTTLVDTAGIREFALWDVDWRMIESAYEEIHEAGARCRFPDCRHDREPGCAVLTAVEQGRIDEKRYTSYLTLASEVE
jgi:ribosome biogenesis GTPase